MAPSLALYCQNLSVYKVGMVSEYKTLAAAILLAVRAKTSMSLLHMEWDWQCVPCSCWTRPNAAVISLNVLPCR